MVDLQGLSDMWLSPRQALRFSPRATRWLLVHYYPFLSKGEWPPQPGAEGQAPEGYLPGRGKGHAPHETASGIAGEMWWRLEKQGRGGLVLFLLFALGWSPKKVSRLMAWTVYGVRREASRALGAIYDMSRPDS